MTIWQWVLMAVGPLVKKVLIMLGIGMVTYSGYSALMDSLRGYVVTAWGTIPATTLNVLTMAGFTEAFGIVLGAIAARVALVAVSRLASVGA